MMMMLVMQDKCHQYWPSERSARYQYFVVDPMAEYNMPQYILREFKVTDARVIDRCCFRFECTVQPLRYTAAKNFPLMLRGQILKSLGTVPNLTSRALYLKLLSEVRKASGVGPTLYKEAEQLTGLLL